MKVTIFGTGYVGLVTGACLADVGHSVVCVDINQSKIDQLNDGVIPIYEPGLEALVKANFNNGSLKFTTNAAEAIKHGQIQFVAVGTPPDEDGSADLQYVLSVAKTIATYMGDYKIIVNKSTVPVGTADKVAEKIETVLAERKNNIDFDVASNPEFLKEGAAIVDFMKPDRIVVGSNSERVKSAMQELYAPFNRNHDRMVFMDVRSAELTKYAANALLATKISFMNEIANLSERLGADVEEVRRGIGSDPRIGYHFIYPGCGYGGSCFPKDVQALAKTADEYGYNAELLKAVQNVNNRQKSRLFEKVDAFFQSNLNGKTFAVWGLAFKPNTDDMREAPSCVLMEALWQAGATVQAYDPEAMEECQRIYGARDDLKLMGTKESALKDSHALIVCTEWKQFRAPDFELIKNQLEIPVIFDGRNLYEPARMQEQGIGYFAIGRPDV